jgi:HEAT repeat protein
VLRVRVERFAATTANVNALPAGHPVVDAAAGSASTLALSVEIAEDGRTQLRAASLATRAGDVAVAALVEQALRDALAQIEQAHATDRLDNDALLAILRSDAESGQRKRRAVLALGSRRDQRATPLALPLLRDEDSATRQSALQALTLLADPRAVEAIIAFSERQPAAIRRQCIDAVKATDSPLAAAWLFVLSTGHPDVEVQAHARAALALLPPTARADAGAPQTAAVEAAN